MEVLFLGVLIGNYFEYWQGKSFVMLLLVIVLLNKEGDFGCGIVLVNY